MEQLISTTLTERKAQIQWANIDYTHALDSRGRAISAGMERQRRDAKTATRHLTMDLAVLENALAKARGEQ